MQLPKDPLKLTVLTACVVAVWVLAVTLSAVLSPFLLAAACAYLLLGWVQRLTRWGLPRPLAALCVEVVFGVLVLALASLVLPVLSHEWPLLREQMPVLIQKLNTLATPWLQSWGVDLHLDVDTLKAFVKDHIGDGLGQTATRMLSSLKLGGSWVLAVLGHAVLVPVALYYMLLSLPVWMARWRQALPTAWRQPVGDFLSECDRVMGGYLRGQLAVMTAMACYYAVALSWGGLELAWPIGIFTGLALCVPYVGFGSGLLLALLAALLQFEPQHALWLVGGIYALGQLMEGLVLTPRWVGERIGLHPMAVIFALLAFGQLLGFMGVLLALPASAMLLVAGRHLVTHWLSREQEAP